MGMGTSVASALTAETTFETMKCVSDVDMPARGRMGTKREIFRFFNSGYGHDRNFSIFGRRASTIGNANPEGIFQTRVYGFDGLQTRVPGYPGLIM